MPATGNNGEVATPGGGRSLPPGFSGLVLIGRLDFAAISTRNAKQVVLDVEVRSPEGRRSIESPSAFVANQDGEQTPMGAFLASGELAKLVGQEVAVIVSVRASAKGDRVYLTAEAVIPLSVPASV